MQKCGGAASKVGGWGGGFCKVLECTPKFLNGLFGVDKQPYVMNWKKLLIVNKLLYALDAIISVYEEANVISLADFSEHSHLF